MMNLITQMQALNKSWQARKTALPLKPRLFVHYAETIIVSLLVVVFIRDYIVQSSRVVSGSMIPTLAISDRLLVTKWSHKFKPVDLGSVVLFKSPNKDGREFVKRVVAIGGERIRIESGVIYVNDTPRSFPGVLVRHDQYTMPEQQVPDNHYFMMGDNRGYSQDSRYWGSVPHADIIGHAWLIYWAFDRAQVIW